MVYLHVLGLIVAAGLLVAAFSRWRRRTPRVSDTVIMAVLAVILAIISIDSSVIQPVMTRLGFPSGNGRRLVGALVLSNIVLYLLMLRAYARTDRLEQKLGDYSDRLAARRFDEEFGAARATRKLGVVIPALNEQSSLPGVLDELPNEVEGLVVEAIVVSDGSTDATERVAADHGALVVRRDLRRGQGAAVALGYAMALTRGAQIVATVDADGQYDPAELPLLVKPILAGEADVVHGSRMLGDYHQPLFGRAQGVRVFSWLTSALVRHPITDPASGFRAFSAEALRELRFREHQFHASEVTVAAAKQGFRVREVPCTFRERSHGQTKKPPLLSYGWGYARSLFRTWAGPAAGPRA